MADAVEIDAPAKVNLRLRVLARETSGYHSLESLFLAISLADQLRVERAGNGIELCVEGDVDTGPPEQNLVVRAAQRFCEVAGLPPAYVVRLRKRIPAAAGLGGGSSDAAATLRALNALEGHPLSPGQLLRTGAALGSDIPFFLSGSAFALGWSRGERLLPLPAPAPLPVLIAHPGEAMPTAAAFAELDARRDPERNAEPAILPLAALGDWTAIGPLAENDFEPVVTSRIPVLRDALGVMRAAEAHVALLAGSGSSVFGVFPDEQARSAAESQLERLPLRLWGAETLCVLPPPRLTGTEEIV